MRKDDAIRPGRSAAEFWSGYLTHLESRRIPKNSLVWYRRHVERFIQAHAETRLRAISPHQVDAYLRRLDRKAVRHRSATIPCS